MLKFIKYRWKWLVAVGVLALIVLVVFRPVMSRVQVWRAGSLLEEAQGHAAAGEWDESLRTSLAALQLDPNFETLLVYFQAQCRTGDGGVLQSAVRIATNEQATAENRANALSVFLDVGDRVNFASILTALDEETREHPKIKFQTLRFLLAGGQVELALGLVEALSEAERSTSFDLLLCSGLIRDQRPAVRQEAFRRLAELLASEDDVVALDAMRIIASQPDGGISNELAQKSLERFADETGLGVGEQFALRLFEIGLEPDRRESIVSAALEKYQDSDLLRLLNWLLRVGEAEQAVALSEARMKELKVFRLRSQALKLVKKYEQLLEELETPPPGISSAELFASRAAVSRLLGRTADEADYWSRALGFARLRSRENHFPVIANIARQVGAEEIGFEALACSIEHPVGVPPESSKLDELYAWLAKNDIDRLLSISRRLLQREPGNPVLVNNYCYLETLHGRADERTVAALAELVEAFPEELSFRGSLAFAHLRLGEAEKALEVIEQSSVVPSEMPNGEKAVYSAALAQAGREDEAAALAATVEWGEMSELEGAVLAPKAQ
jgi:tetratricopeptide (TPR) repeat protein